MSKWSLSVPNTSPSFVYTPFDQWQLNADNTVRSAHSSAVSVALTFSGTGITLLGSTSGSCKLKLDTKTSSTTQGSPSNDVLFEVDSLESGQHKVAVTCNLDQTESLDFKGAMIQSMTQGDTTPVPIRFDNNNSSALAYSNGWSLASAHGIPNNTVTIPYHTTSERGSSVSFNFQGAAGIELQGMSSTDSGLYTVSLGGSDYEFSGTSSVLVPDNVLFFQTGLDPHEEYSITLTNTDNDEGILALNSITIFDVLSSQGNGASLPTEAPSGSESKHPSGQIAGIIGGTMGGMILLSLVVLILFKRRRTAAKASNHSIWRKLGSSKKAIPSGQLPPSPPTPFYDSGNHESYSTLPFGGASEAAGGADPALSDPFASANHSRTDLVLPSAASVIVANDHTGATVMYWAPSDRFLAGASNLDRPTSVAYSSLSQSSPSFLQSDFPTAISAPSTPPASNCSPGSSSLGHLLPTPVPSPGPSMSERQAAASQQPSSQAGPARRTSILKRPFIRLLPSLPLSRAPAAPTSPVPEYPLQEIDAGRIDTSFMARSPTESLQAHPSFPPPQYERGQWP